MPHNPFRLTHTTWRLTPARDSSRELFISLVFGGRRLKPFEATHIDAKTARSSFASLIGFLSFPLGSVLFTLVHRGPTVGRFKSILIMSGGSNTKLMSARKIYINRIILIYLYITSRFRGPIQATTSHLTLRYLPFWNVSCLRLRSVYHIQRRKSPAGFQHSSQNFDGALHRN